MKNIIYIDKTYDVILTFSPILEISGHIFECFDYYLFLLKYLKVGIVLFGNIELNKLKILFEEKYLINFNQICNDILVIHNLQFDKINHLFFGKETKVILTDGNIESLELNKIIFHTSKLYGFSCDNKDYSHVKYNRDIIYLQDFRIYKDNKKDFKTINYVKKLPFQYYKKSEVSPKNIGLVYVTKLCRMITQECLVKYYKLSGCDKCIVITPFRISDFDNLNGIIQMISPVRNLFNLFDTYIYTPVQRKLDCSPRLLTECFFQNKKVYKNLDYYDQALEVRYKDCITNLQTLNLSDNDDILKILQ